MDSNKPTSGADIELKHYKSRDKNARRKELVTEKVAPDSDSGLFLQRMEIVRLAKPCVQTIDMRGKAPGEVRKHVYQEKEHFMDDVSNNLFQEGVKRNGGAFTVGIFDAVVNGDHTFKAMRQADAQQHAAVPEVLDVEAARDDGKGKVPDDYFARHFPEVVQFGYYKKRAAPRLLFVTDVVCGVGEVHYSAKTKDISVAGLQMYIKSVQCPFKEGQTLNITFSGMQEEAGAQVPLSDIPYRVVRIAARMVSRPRSISASVRFSRRGIEPGRSRPASTYTGASG